MVSLKPFVVDDFNRYKITYNVWHMEINTFGFRQTKINKVEFGRNIHAKTQI